MSFNTLLLTGKDFKPHLDFWTQQLQALDEPFQFVREGDSPPVSAPLTHTLEVPLGAQAQAVLNKLTGGKPLESFIILLVGWCLILEKYTGKRGLSMVTPLLIQSGEAPQNPDGVVYILQNMHALHTLKDLIIALNRGITQSYQYQNFPLGFAAQRAGLAESLYHSNVCFRCAGLHQEISTPEAYDLDVTLRQDGCQVRYNAAMFDEVFISSLFSHYHHVLEAFGDVQQPLKNISLTDATEKHQVLFAFNQTRADYPRQASVVALFEAQVATTPNAPAVFFEGETLTYAELNARANRLAHWLRTTHYIQRDEFVALMLGRSVEMVVAIWGVLKAGGAYLPIEPDAPAARRELMLKDTQAKVLLGNCACEDLPEDLAVYRIDQLDLPAQCTNPAPVNCGEDLIYVMYTSGSTGQPKGVLAHHRGVVRLVKNTNYSAIQPGQRILQLSNYAFDGSTFDIFGALLNGATLYLFPQAYLLDLEKLRGFIAEHQINVTFITTALFNKLTDLDSAWVSHFDKIYFGGQDASLAHVRQALLHRKNADSIVHVYGPTEATTFATFYVVRELPEAATAIPIGAAIGHSLAYILDKDLNPLPIGLSGEIYVSGDGIARGYLNQPELSAERFLDNPFVPGERMYKTGDVGRWDANGQIIFQGRIDEQVKIRGFRVEPGEIENTLLKHPAIRQAFVMARKLDSGNKELIAYLVTDTGLKVTEARAFLTQSLPDYMVPAHFVPLPSLPLNPNGKVDKRALPSPEQISLDLGSTYEASHSANEQILVDIWQDVLGKSQIGVHDNYFALGGDSIKAIQIASRLHQSDLKVEVGDLFMYQTIAELAERVQAAQQNIDQSAVTGTVPLTPIQHWFFQTYNGEAWFNQSVLLRARERLEPEALRRALQALQVHHDALRMKYTPHGASWQQELQTPDIDLHLKIFDWRECEASMALLMSTTESLQGANNLQGMMRAALLQMPDGDRLLIVIHHLVVDGVSWRILVEDLYTAYQQAQTLQKIQLPPKTQSFKAWSEYLHRLAASGTVQADYWQHLGSGQTLRVDFPAAPVGHEADTETLRFELSAPLTAQLLGPAHEAYRTEMNDLLLTALARALYQWQNIECLVLTLEGHGREGAGGQPPDISRTVGWFTTMFPVLLQLPAETEIGRQIKEIKECVRRIPHKGAGYGVLRYLNDNSVLPASDAQLSFNYLGQFDNQTSEGLFTLAEESSGCEVSPQAPRVHELDITGMVSNGVFSFSILYNRHRFRAATLQTLADALHTALEEVIQHCLGSDNAGLTPSDIDYDGMNIDDLDAMLEGL